MKKLLTGVVFMLCFGNVLAQEPEIYQKNGLAIAGYDAVAFFTESKPTRGLGAHSFLWKGATWTFSSDSNLAKFRDDPQKYAPQYGGYCAYGMSNGYKAPTQAETWTIIDSKLYFNYNKQVKETWSKDPSGYIRKADVNWGNTKHAE